MKLAICGPGRCGKDEASAYFKANTHLRYWGSTSDVIAPVVAERLNISVEHARARRHKDREFWREVGDEMRQDDPGMLARVVLSLGDICCGVRSKGEIRAVRDEKMVDLVVWIDRPGLEEDPTLEYGEEMADVIVPNWWGIAEYHERLRKLAGALGILR